MGKNSAIEWTAIQRLRAARGECFTRVDISFTYICPTTPQKVVALFCIVWPFLAMASAPRRGHSSAPFSAAIVALAVVACGLWLDLADLVGGLAVSGAGLDSAKDGLRWIFGATKIAIWPIAWIALFTLVLRHRPHVDSFVITLAIMLAIHVLAAFLFVQVFAPNKSLMVFARTAAAVTIPTAMIAALRLFFATRS